MVDRQVVTIVVFTVHSLKLGIILRREGSTIIDYSGVKRVLMKTIGKEQVFFIFFHIFPYVSTSPIRMKSWMICSVFLVLWADSRHRFRSWGCDCHVVKLSTMLLFLVDAQFSSKLDLRSPGIVHH